MIGPFGSISEPSAGYESLEMSRMGNFWTDLRLQSPGGVYSTGIQFFRFLNKGLIFSQSGFQKTAYSQNNSTK